jgi:hypothetical protein
MIEYEDPTRSSSTVKTTVSWSRRNWAMKEILAKSESVSWWSEFLHAIRSLKWHTRQNEL